MELCRRSTETSLDTRTAKYSPPDGALAALPSPGGSCHIHRLPHLQLFFLEEDLSVDGVGAGGCGVSSGGGRGLWPGSDQLQFCICQALLLRRPGLEKEDVVIAFEITANY